MKSADDDREAPDVPYRRLQEMQPDSIRATLPDAPWDLERLWDLDLPVLKISLSELTWMFDLPLWQKDKRRFQIAPTEVMSAPRSFPAHYKRILDADIDYPIHVTEHNGRLVVLDGIHRVAKAAIEGRDDIPAMLVSSDDLDAISRPPIDK